MSSKASTVGGNAEIDKWRKVLGCRVTARVVLPRSFFLLHVHCLASVHFFSNRSEDQQSPLFVRRLFALLYVRALGNGGW